CRSPPCAVPPRVVRHIAEAGAHEHGAARRAGLRRSALAAFLVARLVDAVRGRHDPSLVAEEKWAMEFRGPRTGVRTRRETLSTLALEAIVEQHVERI